MENIIFDKVSINNFLSIENADVELSERGFIVVKGRNEESQTVQSNGSGKSTIFDSIFWTLTGSTLRGADDVVNENRKKEGCLCSLDFHSGDKTFKIVRTKSHKEYGNSCRFYVNEELVSDQTKKSQEMITKTIPSVASSEILGSIILLGQGLPYRFSSFSPSKRKDLLETMSGSSTEISKVKYKLDIEESDHTRRINDVRAEISKNQGIISGLDSTVNLLTSQIESVSSYDQVMEKTCQLEQEVESYQDSGVTLEKEIESLESQLKTVNEALDRVRDLRQEYNNSYTLINNSLSSMKSGNCPTCGRPFEVTEESRKQKEVLETKRADCGSRINTLNEKFNSLDAQVKKISQEISDKSNAITSLEYKISENQREIERLNKQLDDLNNLKNQLDETKKKIDSLKITINDDNKVIDTEQEILDCIGYLKRQLSRDFKGYMLEEVIKFMSTRSEYYSDYLFTNGKKIEITLSGNKILISVGGRLYENLSGGERQRVDLAVQFALRDMLVTTSGFSCNLLVLDEAFDNLDEQGSDALIKLVVSEFSDVDSVFVVTHHSEIDIPYDSEITVVKGSDGLSRLEMSY